eukprot:SAG31_NODE_35_length_31836_cov_10.841352_14_plen_69_part_00
MGAAARGTCGYGYSHYPNIHSLSVLCCVRILKINLNLDSNLSTVPPVHVLVYRRTASTAVPRYQVQLS